MFYGGRLLSHLSADDDEVSEFIQLRALNRNVAIIMDSDRENAHKGINDTKRRIQREFAQHGGVAWLTKGREIENYVDHSELQRAVAAVYGTRYARPAAGGNYDHALYFYGVEKRNRKELRGKVSLVKSVDKVKVAREVALAQANLGMSDLRQRIWEIVGLIHGANDMAPVGPTKRGG